MLRAGTNSIAIDAAGTHKLFPRSYSSGLEEGQREISKAFCYRLSLSLSLSSSGFLSRMSGVVYFQSWLFWRHSFEVSEPPGSLLLNLWFWFGLLSSSTTRVYSGRLTNLSAATHVTKRGDHDFCLSRSHYTDTDPTSRERAATAAIEPRTSSPGVAHSTD